MAEIYQPHDRLFRAVFSDASEAASLLRSVLPDFVRGSLEWASLTLTPGTFVDEELRLSETDLLYQVEHTGTGQPASVYVLLEHQSSPDPLMRLRLLRYSCRIWEADLRDNPGRRPLRTIVPVVFYQGTSAWTYSTEFSDLFSEATRAWPWTPRFSHVLLDQTTLTPETVTGKVRTRIVQLLLMAASGHHTHDALRLAAELAATPEARDPSNLSLFVEYLTQTQDPEGINLFDEAMKDRGIDIGVTLMTYAQEMMEKGRAEGEATGRTKGRMETQVENVQGLLQAGVAWEVITTATGLTEADFEELKAQLADSDS